MLIRLPSYCLQAGDVVVKVDSHGTVLPVELTVSHVDQSNQGWITVTWSDGTVQNDYLSTQFWVVQA